MCLALALSLAAAEPDASKLFKEGKKAERAGDIVRAYLLYSEAAAQDPTHPEYWQRAEVLRTRASLEAKPLPKTVASDEPEPQPMPAAHGFETTISEEDLADLQRLKPPPELKAAPGRKTLDLRGSARNLFEQAAQAFGLDTVFDGDYQEGGPPLHIQLEDADFRDALHALEAATESFVVPLGEHLFLVVKDTIQKRAEVEPTVAVSVPIPDTVTVQEAQELGRAVQQTMELLKVAIDGDRQIVIFKDRISKVLPAQVLFEELARRRPEVEIEMQLLEVDSSSLYSYGLLLPTSFPISFAGGSSGSLLLSLARSAFRTNLFTVAIANTQLFGTMSRSNSQDLFDAQVRSIDGEAATFHVGEKYPILTGTFVGVTAGGIPPSFNFEDLGLLLKVTPHVHGAEEISLDLTAEFELLAGQSVNGIPVLTNHKLESKVRLRDGEWALISGLMSSSEAKTITGIPGFMTLPVLGPPFRENERNRSSSEVVVLIKPRLLSLPPTESLTRTLDVGAEGRLRTPL